MQQRRRFPRTTITGPVTVRTARGTDLRLVDVSVSGCRCVGARPLRPGQVIRLFLPAGEGQLSVEARVRRCRAVTGRDGFPGIAYEAGLEFVNLNPATVAAIERAYLGDTLPGDSREAEGGAHLSMARAG